jgi:hypothetical protein
MKRQKSCGPRLGKLVHQLPGVVTFAYDLRFRRVIARWKGIVEEIHFGGSIMPSAIIENLDLEKPSFRPSKWPRKLKPAKNSKLPKWPENCFEPFGKGGWPPISTWINPPSLGSNGLHCIEFPGEREKHLLNLHLGELLVLLEKSRCLVCGNLSRTCGWKVWTFLTSLAILDDCVQKESSCFAATLSTCFCWIEGALAEAVVVAVSFCSPFEQIVEKMNFLV